MIERIKKQQIKHKHTRNKWKQIVSENDNSIVVLFQFLFFCFDFNKSFLVFKKRIFSYLLMKHHHCYGNMFRQLVLNRSHRNIFRFQWSVRLVVMITIIMSLENCVFFHILFNSFLNLSFIGCMRFMIANLFFFIIFCSVFFISFDSFFEHISVYSLMLFFLSVNFKCILIRKDLTLKKAGR